MIQEFANSQPPTTGTDRHAFTYAQALLQAARDGTINVDEQIERLVLHTNIAAVPNDYHNSRRKTERIQRSMP